MGQDAEVEHVRVGEDRVRPRPHLASLVDRRVAVVDRRTHAGNAERGEAARLVLRERLRRIEVERTRLRVAGDRVEHREVERERLAARGAGGDGDVLPACAAAHASAWCSKSLRDAPPRERCDDALVELGGSGAVVAFAPAPDVTCDLLSGEQLVRERGDGHPSATTSSVRGSGLEQLLQARHALVVPAAARQFFTASVLIQGPKLTKVDGLGVPQQPRPRAELLEVAPLDPLLQRRMNSSSEPGFTRHVVCVYVSAISLPLDGGAVIVLLASRRGRRALPDDCGLRPAAARASRPISRRSPPQAATG